MKESILMDLFYKISEIPRASFQEKALSDYIVKFAQNLRLDVFQDEFNNVLVKKPASSGYEAAPVVMLQAHLDMVAEKNESSTHNFESDPLELMIENGFLKANQTTLGADNGVGVVYMMALLQDKTLEHPALECVFTVEEEVGLIGATNFDTSNLKASYCIGLDSSGENEVYVSSSGGVRSALTKNLTFEAKESTGYSLKIRGLKGGHSGGDIHLERGNALKLLGIIMKRALDEFNVRLVDINGGLKINAIPRESEVVFYVDDAQKFSSWFESVKSELLLQYTFSEPNLEFELKPKSISKVFSKKDTEDVVNTLFMLPYGVIQKSMAIDDLVITSANIGTINVEGNELLIQVSLRATQSFVMENVIEMVSLIAKLFNFSVAYSSRYPGWEYEPKSKLRQRLFEVHHSLRDEEMREVATHGGVELGIWKGKMPHLDIVSLGPIMVDIHTPDERLDIASFIRTYEVLSALILSLNSEIQ